LEVLIVGTPLDDVLRLITEGMPAAPKHYELRCHPDVYQALFALSEADPGECFPQATPSPLFGSADIVVDARMHPGTWELREGDKIVKWCFRGPDGRLYMAASAEIPVPPAVVFTGLFNSKS
jgi:hypothetical protein